MFIQLLEGGPTFDLDTSETLLSVDELNVTETVSLFVNSFILLKSNSAIAYILQYCLHMQNVEACKLATLVQETTNAMNQVLFFCAFRLCSIFHHCSKISSGNRVSPTLHQRRSVPGHGWWTGDLSITATHRLIISLNDGGPKQPI